jgi:hypothetical protein
VRLAGGARNSLHALEEELAAAQLAQDDARLRAAARQLAEEYPGSFADLWAKSLVEEASKEFRGSLDSALEALRKIPKPDIPFAGGHVDPDMQVFTRIARLRALVGQQQ